MVAKKIDLSLIKGIFMTFTQSDVEELKSMLKRLKRICGKTTRDSFERKEYKRTYAHLVLLHIYAWTIYESDKNGIAVRKRLYKFKKEHGRYKL